jgi:hypothetical protein
MPYETLFEDREVAEFRNCRLNLLGMFQFKIISWRQLELPAEEATKRDSYDSSLTAPLLPRPRLPVGDDRQR